MIKNSYHPYYVSSEIESEMSETILGRKPYYRSIMIDVLCLCDR